MKLGIPIVYLVSDDNEKLLDIHLDYIQKNTKSDYLIYAGINMLLPRFIEKLRKFEYIKIYECKPYVGPSDNRRGGNEHSHYLDQLIQVALGDGVDYLALMHPDSFPVKKNWDAYLIKMVTEHQPLISIFPQMSACTFFHKDFYINYSPKLLPSKKEENSVEWKNFQKGNEPNNLIETGMGYAFKIYQEELIWNKLKKTSREDFHHHFGGIYGDVIFHLGSASMYDTRPMSGYVKQNKINKLRKRIVELIPTSIKEKLKSILPIRLIYPEAESNKKDYLKIRESLLTDSRKFIKSILR